ncbi:MAG: peroxiredoxin Q/BCP [Myxococcota bacterium]|jgi:peroxiredoxin Q/BCP
MMDKVNAAGAVVLGASVDSVASHRAFSEKYELNYPLLSDTDGKLSAAMGVLNKLGPIKLSARVTFLIDGEGRIARVFDPVSPSGHADEVLAALG